jgi:hypothetical protein
MQCPSMGGKLINSPFLLPHIRSHLVTDEWCWSCYVRKGCASKSPIASDGRSLGHFRRCVRMCSSCSLKSHQDRYNYCRGRWKKCFCELHAYDERPDERWVCLICKRLGQRERADERLRYEAALEKQSPPAESPHCDKCSVRLPKAGPRWYSCRYCNGECMSSQHKPWSWGHSTSGFRVLGTLDRRTVGR